MRRIRLVVSALLLLTWSGALKSADVIGLDHFAINVHDLQASADWYKKVLGLRLLHKWSNVWMVGKDNVKIGLFLTPNAKPLPDIDSQLIIQHVAFLVDGDKFADLQKEIVEKGIAIHDIEDTGIAYSFFFNDPDGHLLEVTTYHAAVTVPPSAK